VRLRGRDVQAQPGFVRVRAEVESLLRTMMIVNRLVASFVPFIGPGDTIDPEEPETAIDHGFAIVRWHLSGPEEGGSLNRSPASRSRLGAADGRPHRGGGDAAGAP
jgi:hypothetical protein